MRGKCMCLSCLHVQISVMFIFYVAEDALKKNFTIEP